MTTSPQARDAAYAKVALITLPGGFSRTDIALKAAKTVPEERAPAQRPTRLRQQGGRMIPNVLANRYASAAMREIWSPEAKIVAERRLWLAVLRAQADLGVDFGGADAGDR